MDGELQNKIIPLLIKRNRKYSISKQIIFETGLYLYDELSSLQVSEDEVDLMEELWSQHKYNQIIAKQSKIGIKRIEEIQQKVLRSVLELFNEINRIKAERRMLRGKYFLRRTKLFLIIKKNNSLKNDQIFDSQFKFSTRFRKIIKSLNIVTYQDIIEVPICDFTKYRGFQGKCLQELIDFIEFENIEDKFGGFSAFKKKYYRVKK
ncbi:hypothetical protein [Chryseobacterium viscerum]|nr:hypothetical protein [Chryseobacterium viscerum]